MFRGRGTSRRTLTSPVPINAKWPRRIAPPPRSTGPPACLPQECLQGTDGRAILVQDVLACPDRRDAARMEVRVAHEAPDDVDVVLEVARGELAVQPDH